MDKAVNDIIVNGSDVHKFMNTVCSRVVNHNWGEKVGTPCTQRIFGPGPTDFKPSTTKLYSV